ncbi:MAG TPA: hypothetical protein VFQ72_01650 [Candidatus Paceibacterota bacterium]|nr:hypothetical protein [Candidatus Paceibacterota bacterium]
MTQDTLDTKGTEQSPAIHDLFSRPVRPIRNWSEWLERWQAAVTFEEMRGLLHGGFDVSLQEYQYGEKEYSHVDRLAFYCTIADGWSGSLDMRRDGDFRLTYRLYDSEREIFRDVNPSEVRETLANKAVDMLCSRFFKPLVAEEVEAWTLDKRWKYGIFSQAKALDSIMGFFRIDPGPVDAVTIKNVGRRTARSNTERIIQAFLAELARRLWRFKDVDVSHFAEPERAEKVAENAKRQAQIEKVKLWMIEVLAYINRLEDLNGWLLVISKPQLAKLKEIALRSSLSEYGHPVTKSRMVANLDEACYAGSAAAWFLKRQELVSREHSRLEKIQALERERQQADRRMKELTRSKA